MRRRTWMPTIAVAIVLLIGGAEGPLPGVRAAESDLMADLVERGQMNVQGREVPYRIRNLPVSSFPQLPAEIATALTARGCVIPQTYEAHRPENVIEASFERAGSKDWAVLCSVHERVELLVFFGDRPPETPMVVATVAKSERLQRHDASGELGFNWGIDPASPARVHEAQAGMAHRPAAPDHDSVGDSILDRKTVYRLFREGAWEVLPTE